MSKNKKADNLKKAIQAIDTLSIQLSTAKAFGKKATAVRDQKTSAMQWLVADIVYQPKQLTELISSWLLNSSLTEEPRRTAKESLVRAIHSWGEGNVKVEISERGDKQGVSVTYPDQAKQARETYNKGVQQLAKLIDKLGQVALYDALGVITAEQQEKALDGMLTIAKKTSADTKAMDIKTVDMLKRMADETEAMKTELFG